MSEIIEVESGVAVEADHESAPKLEELVKTYLTIRDAKSNLYREYQNKNGQLLSWLSIFFLCIKYDLVKVAVTLLCKL